MCFISSRKCSTMNSSNMASATLSYSSLSRIPNTYVTFSLFVSCIFQPEFPIFFSFRIIFQKISSTLCYNSQIFSSATYSLLWNSSFWCLVPLIVFFKNFCRFYWFFFKLAAWLLMRSLFPEDTVKPAFVLLNIVSIAVLSQGLFLWEPAHLRLFWSSCLENSWWE